MARTLRTTEDTQHLAEEVACLLKRGDVLTLAGDLGAGKTTFAQFLIRALSPQPVEVTSPTFTLLQTYPVQLPPPPGKGSMLECFHYDLYRIEHESALYELGLEEALHGITLIEWPERLGGYAMPVSLALSFALTENGTRTVTIAAHDPRFNPLCA